MCRYMNGNSPPLPRRNRFQKKASRRHLGVSKNGGFPQQPWDFLLKMIILGCFRGTPISETSIWRVGKLREVFLNTARWLKHSDFCSHKNGGHRRWPIFVLVILLGWALRLQHLRDAYSTRFPFKKSWLRYAIQEYFWKCGYDVESIFLAGREANSHMFALTISFSRGAVWGGFFLVEVSFPEEKIPHLPGCFSKKFPKETPKLPPRFPKESRWFPLKT